MQTHKVLLRHLAVQHQGNGQQYENFKRMIEASPLLYQHDFHFYNDTIAARHQRNIKEIKYIQQLIKNGKITPQMLSNNIYNTFYPSYVLAHHYSVFVPLLHKIRYRVEVTQILKAATLNTITGAFLHEIKATDFKNQLKTTLPHLDEKGILKMNENIYFYSSVTSPYITHATFISQDTAGEVLVIVAIRDRNGQLCKGIKAIDFGGTISSDYLPIGYNFSGIKPCLVLNLEPKILRSLQYTHLQQHFAQFNYSLKDFQKSLWITIKYTSMRKQFKTLADSKDERKIITYQAVANRIIQAFAQYQGLSDLYARILQQPNRFNPIVELLSSSHHIILENLVHLRECCGGFGFMQVSGHPGCIERVANRAGNQPQQHLKTDKNYLKAMQYYSGSEEIEEFFMQTITESSVTYMQFFGVFLSICQSMREKKEQMTAQQYRREFFKQSSIFALHSRQEISNYDGDNIHCQLLQYFLLGYILKNVRYMRWDLIKIDREIFFDQLNTKRAAGFDLINKELLGLSSTLELTYLRNTVVGRENEEEFYTELLETSKANLRNSKEYREYVREPIAQMIIENRARL